MPLKYNMVRSDDNHMTRKHSLANNLPRYFGEPCSKGHIGERYTKSGNCVNCIRAKYVPSIRGVGKEKCPFRTKARENGDMHYFTGRPCINKHIAERRTTSGSCVECHKNRPKSGVRDYGLRSKYGINLSEYNWMLLAQGGKCKLCNKKEDRLDSQTKELKSLSVDHCHDTGKIRGLLCSSCNMGIGLMKHDPKILRKAAIYCEETE